MSYSVKPAAARRPKMSTGQPGRRPAPAAAPLKKPIIKRKSTSCLPLDRVSMLVMEANEISSYLGKSYVFSLRQEVVADDDCSILVTNKRYALSCFWSLSKLKERLMRMRKLMYARESENSGIGGESVFFDPKDEWTRDENVAVNTSNNSAVWRELESVEQALELLKREAQSTRAPEKPAASAPTGKGSAPTYQSAPKHDDQVPLRRPRPRSAHVLLGSGEGPVIALTAPHRNSISGPLVGNAGGRVTDIRMPKNGSAQNGGGGTTVLVEHMGTNSFNGYSTGGSTSSELPADTEFIPTSSPEASPAENSLPEKYLLGGPWCDNSPPVHRAPSPSRLTLHPTRQKKPSYPTTRTADVAVQTSTSSCQSHQGAPMLTLCKEMINMTLERLKGEGVQTQLVDKILSSCESIKVATINILEAFTQAQETGEAPATFADCELVRLMSMQLVASLELLVNQTSEWQASFCGSDLTDINTHLDSTVKELAAELLAFIQGCENDAASQADDAAARVVDLLYTLARLCGELAITTETCPTSLADTHTLEELLNLSSPSEDLVRFRPSSDVKQSFLSGGDCVVKRSLQRALSALEAAEDLAQSLTLPPRGATQTQTEKPAEVLKHVFIVAATAKIMVLKCQEIQVEVGAQMRSDCLRAEDYFHRYYIRSEGLMVHVNSLVDGVTLLMQAAEPLTQEFEGGTLRKICRCSEMTQRSCLKLLAAGSSDSLENSAASVCLSSVNGLSKTLLSRSSLLTQPQSDQLEQSAEDVRVATQALSDLAKRQLALTFVGDVKVKRMLPLPPHGRQMVRCQSAKSLDRRARLSRNLSLLEENTNNPA